MTIKQKKNTAMQESVNFLEAGGGSGTHETWDDDPWAQNMFENIELDEVCF